MKQRLEMLRRWDRGAAAVVDWLQFNQHKFASPIVLPPIVSLFLSQGKSGFVNAVESMFFLFYF